MYNIFVFVCVCWFYEYLNKMVLKAGEEKIIIIIKNIYQLHKQQEEEENQRVEKKYCN